MAGQLRVGILAFHGDVSEHELATKHAAQQLDLHVIVSLVREKKQLVGLDALIIPGGESTTLYKLCVREDMIDAIKKIPAIFGTCAGAIMLSQKIDNPTEGQKSLGLMNIQVDRNAYGRQAESFETELETVLGTSPAIFIRAPKITAVGPQVKTLAQYNGTVVACDESVKDKYYLAVTFHPELTTTKFHEYFLRKLPYF